MTAQKSSIDWDALRVVLAIHRAGTLRGGARMLGVNHSTVTRRLVQLETSLGARLFDRRPEGYVTTQAGEDLLAVAERMETDLLSVERRVLGRDDTPRGLVRVNIPPAMIRSFLAQELVQFARLHPGIELDVDASHSLTDLARREADVTLRMATEISEDVVARKVADYAKAIYAAPDLAEEIGTSGPDPSRHIWLGWGRDGPQRDFPEATPFPHLPVRHKLFANALQIEAVVHGLGIALLPCFLGDPNPGLHRVPGTGILPGKSIWLLYHGDLKRTARIRTFMDHMVPAIQRHRKLIRGDMPDAGRV